MLTVSPEEFESFVKEGVEAIPEKFRARINNAAFLVHEKPTAEQRRQHKLRPRETLFGLYEGIPHPARGENYGGLVMPDRITIFKQPIEAEARFLTEEHFSKYLRPYVFAKWGALLEQAFRDKVRKLVIDTVWHEVAHHFGLDEEGVAERERQRRHPRA